MPAGVTSTSSRQNPEYFEVLDGLEAGGQVIVSGYETLAGYDRIVLE